MNRSAIQTQTKPPFKTHKSVRRLRSTDSIASVQAEKLLWRWAEPVAGLNTVDRILVGLHNLALFLRLFRGF